MVGQPIFTSTRNRENRVSTSSTEGRSFFPPSSSDNNPAKPRSLPDGDNRQPSVSNIRLQRDSLYPRTSITSDRRMSLAPELPIEAAFGKDPPFTLHKNMLPRLNREYQTWYNEYLIDHAFMVNTHLYEPKLLRKGGKQVPGPSPCLQLPTKDFEVPARPGNPDVPVRVWWPSTEMPEGGWPLFVWAHGGGWILGSKNTENNFTTRIAEWSKCCVVSVGYRLAPENPYPDCLEDFWDVLLWAHANPELLNINPKRTAIGGSSAGGNIASVIAHQYADSGLPPLLYQALLVPVTDNTAGPETHISWKENEYTPQLPAAKMLVYREYYLAHPSLYTQPQASPIFFPDESFAKVPPALVISASADVLRTENEMYVEKMRANGVDAKHVIYQQVPHHVMGLCQVLERGRALIMETADALRHVYYGPDDVVSHWY